MVTEGEKYLRIRRAGMSDLYLTRRREIVDIPGSKPRWQIVLAHLQKDRKKTATEMMCIISYDIEHNKVRRVIARYLIREGCIRVQKSVYVARLERKKFQEISETLKAIQEMYDNHDSIFLLPVGEEQIHRLIVIGRNLEMELITHPPHTLII